jgi:chromosome segregation and condensation protein ScpB
MLYATTEKFLRVFGLNSLADLPQTELPKPPANEEAAVTVEENPSDANSEKPE